MRWVTLLLTMCSLLAVADSGWAQNDGSRPATTTLWGDTGLWFVPTGEVLPRSDLSFSVHRTEEDFRQGNTSVSFWPVTGAVGTGRREFFGAMRVVTRIDRDTTPLLFAGPDNEAGGLLNEHPTVRESWTGNKLGDLFLGGKVNITSQERLQPLAFALRGTVKLPTGNQDSGAGTGEYDWFGDVIGSREFRGVELAGFGGLAVRGDPDAVKISDGFRWGAGIGFPTRRSIRATAELYGEWLFDDVVTAPAGFVVGTDGSRSPATSRLKDPINAVFGLTWQHPSGVLLGAAVNYRFGLETPSAAGIPRSTSGDAIGLEFRIGFHGGVNVFVPPPPVVLAPAEPAPAPATPPPPAPVPNQAPTVRAVCDPCSIHTGGTATLRAQTSDPDGDVLSVLWSATGGTIADARAAITRWHAETAPGLVTFTVVVDDGRGARATDTVTIEVTDGETVLFDFDSSVLRPEALPLLEPIVTMLNANRDTRVEIEGHTCNVGTAEYNLALGERRASAVRDYLMGRGIAGYRLTTISYGEERPAHDNSTAETRRLNRRAVVLLRATDAEADSSR